MKPIDFSDHAEERRKQRGLTRQEIELVLENPEYTKILEDRKIAVKEVKGRIVTVVYTEEENYIRVITIF